MNTLVRVRLPHSAITKAVRLLPLMYSIRELCDELSVPRHLIQSWLKAGLPHNRDNRQHIWIYGEDCYTWIKENHQLQKPKTSLEGNQAFCLRCNKSIIVINPRIVTNNSNRRLTGFCPDCGGTVNKGVKNDQSQQLQIGSRISSIQKGNQSTMQ